MSFQHHARPVGSTVGLGAVRITSGHPHRTIRQVGQPLRGYLRRLVDQDSGRIEVQPTRSIAGVRVTPSTSSRTSTLRSRSSNQRLSANIRENALAPA